MQFTFLFWWSILLFWSSPLSSNFGWSVAHRMVFFISPTLSLLFSFLARLFSFCLLVFVRMSAVFCTVSLSRIISTLRQRCVTASKGIILKFKCVWISSYNFAIMAILNRRLRCKLTSKNVLVLASPSSGTVPSMTFSSSSSMAALDPDKKKRAKCHNHNIENRQFYLPMPTIFPG